MGDRFGHQGKAQLRACVLATEMGRAFRAGLEQVQPRNTPSSARSRRVCAPKPTRRVKALGWKQSYHVDADHIRLETVDRFIAPSDFFTIDVADSIGKPAAWTEVKAFVDRPSRTDRHRFHSAHCPAV